MVQNQGKLREKHIEKGKDALMFRNYNKAELQYRIRTMENPLQWLLKTASSTPSLLLSPPSKSPPRLLTQDKLPRVNTSNPTDMKVVSPFYDRNKVCKNKNCFCPYHKRIREEVSRRMQKGKGDRGLQSAHMSPHEKGEDHHGRQSKFKRAFRTSLPTQLSKELTQKLSQSNNLKNISSKLDITNAQFQSFLRTHMQWLLKKQKHKQLDPHIIKSSVHKIFRYIHTHIHEPRSIVKEYIESVVKDRAVNQYFLDRYDQLKRKKQRQKDGKGATRQSQASQALSGKKSLKKVKFNKQSKKANSSKDKLVDEVGKKHQFYDSLGSFGSFGDSFRKGGRRKSAPLLTQIMIKDIQDGYEIDETHLQKLKTQPLQNFLENIYYIHKVIPKQEEETLIQIRDNILLPLKQHFSSQKQNPETTSKLQQIQIALKMIEYRISSLKSDKQDQDDKDQAMSFRSNNSKRRKTKRISQRESIFKRDAEALQIIAKLNKQTQEDQLLTISEEDRNDDKVINNMFDPNYMKGQRQKKQKERLKLAKFRRLSHDFFHHKTILNEDDQNFQPTTRKLPIEILQQIGSKLDMLAEDLQKKYHSMKKIQSQIQRFNLKNFLVGQDDCLLTIKRKARAFQDLIDENVVPDGIKIKILQYLSFLQQQNYVRHRKWAQKKIQAMIFSQNVQLNDSNNQQEKPQDRNSYVKDIIKDIFGNKLRLIFYDVTRTQFEQEQADFQTNLFAFLDKQQAKEQRQKRTLFTKYLAADTRKEQRKNTQEDKSDEGNLVQVGLNNTDHFGMEMTDIEKQIEKSIEDTTLISKKDEDTYLKLFQMLQKLNK